MERVSADLLKSFVKRNSPRKVSLNELQQLGVYMAEQLEDTSHLTLYFRLLKYEPRWLLMRAYSYAASFKGNKAAIFLKKLKELKEREKFRLFVALFPLEINDDLKGLLKSISRDFSEDYKITSQEYLHLTLFFCAKCPAVYYPRLVRIVGKLQEKYGEDLVLAATQVRVLSGYLWLTGFQSSVYRYYYGLRKLLNADKDLKNYIPDKSRFYPHITLGRAAKRVVNPVREVKTLNVDVGFPVGFRLAVSYLTNEGPVYKIHATY